MLRRKSFSILVFCISMLLAATAKDSPVQTIVWPESGTTVLRFSFGKFKEVSAVGNQRVYTIDTTAENLWSKTISSANFSLYLFDKSKTRIGEGLVTVTNIGPGETIKFQTTIASSGTPVSLSLSAQYIPPELKPAAPARTISITVNSVPQGASVKIDGDEAGTTPKMLQVGVGKHMLEFSKEGFNTGHFPLEIGLNDASGGSVSYELGTSAHDTVELRDGSVLSGDLESVSATDVVIRIGGTSQSFKRNQVKRILLVERDAPN
jgi:PEGA domain-containing protein